LVAAFWAVFNAAFAAVQTGFTGGSVLHDSSVKQMVDTCQRHG
jgi:hypothetical protein